MYNKNPIDTYLPTLYINSNEIIDISELKKNISTTFKEIHLNKKIKKICIIFLGTLFYAQKVFATTEGLNGFDALGNKILSVLQGLGYWVCVAMCIKDIVENALSGGKAKDIGGIIVKYLVLLASLHYVPQLFKEVPTMFNN